MQQFLKKKKRKLNRLTTKALHYMCTICHREAPMFTLLIKFNTLAKITSGHYNKLIKVMLKKKKYFQLTKN